MVKCKDIQSCDPAYFNQCPALARRCGVEPPARSSKPKKSDPLPTLAPPIATPRVPATPTSIPAHAFGGPLLLTRAPATITPAAAPGSKPVPFGAIPETQLATLDVNSARPLVELLHPDATPDEVTKILAQANAIDPKTEKPIYASPREFYADLAAIALSRAKRLKQDMIYGQERAQVHLDGSDHKGISYTSAQFHNSENRKSFEEAKGLLELAYQYGNEATRRDVEKIWHGDDGLKSFDAIATDTNALVDRVNREGAAGLKDLRKTAKGLIEKAQTGDLAKAHELFNQHVPVRGTGHKDYKDSARRLETASKLIGNREALVESQLVLQDLLRNPDEIIAASARVQQVAGWLKNYPVRELNGAVSTMVTAQKRLAASVNNPGTPEELKREVATSLSNSATLLAKRGDRKTASEFMVTAVALDPKNVQARLNKAEQLYSATKNKIPNRLEAAAIYRGLLGELEQPDPSQTLRDNATTIRSRTRELYPLVIDNHIAKREWEKAQMAALSYARRFGPEDLGVVLDAAEVLNRKKQFQAASRLATFVHSQTFIAGSTKIAALSLRAENLLKQIRKANPDSTAMLAKS